MTDAAQTSRSNGASARPARAMLVDDDPLTIAGLRGLLAPFESVEVAATAYRREDPVTLAAKHRPDVVLLDVKGSGDPLTMVGRLRAEAPPVAVVFYTYIDDEVTVTTALNNGARGYILKSSPPQLLVDALAAAVRGELVLDPDIEARVGRTAPWRPGRSAGLSPREVDVLLQLGSGKRNQEIARELGVGDETVKTHLASLYKKLGVSDRAHAMAEARRRRIIA